MYNYKKPVLLGYADAVAKVKDELKKEGFGVFTEIDIKLKKAVDAVARQ